MRLLLSLLTIGVAPLAAQQIQVIEEGGVHEAYLTPVSETIVLDAVAEKPPQPVLEKQPGGGEEGMEWVPGYWSWSTDRDDFVWMTGVWRRPPPGHQWISGHWEHLDEGWVWLQGFWSRVALSDTTPIKKRPPDPMGEGEESSPGDDSFWIPGYWSYDEGSDGYSWLAGRWESLDPDWVFVPSHYTWREDGYIFIPGYWDWPIDQIGMAYNNIFVVPGERVSVVYEPSGPIQTDVVIRRCFVYYPNYIVWYHHHYHYHTGWWNGWCCTPSWWGWGGWWGLSWNNQWSLFWWWGHPGWPQPFWLVGNFAQAIAPPHQQLLNMFKGVRGPLQITPKGMVNANQLIGERKMPVLPANRADREKIIDRAEQGLKQPDQILRPEGKGTPPDQLKRPNARKPGERPPASGGRVDAPPRKPKPQARPQRQPERPSERPEVRPVRPTPESRPQPRPRPTPESRPQPQPRPRPTPESRPRPRPRPTPESRPRPRPRPTPESRPQPRPRPTPESRPQPRPRPTPESRPQRRPGPSEVRPQTEPRQTRPRQSRPQEIAPPQGKVK